MVRPLPKAVYRGVGRVYRDVGRVCRVYRGVGRVCRVYRGVGRVECIEV